MNLTNEKSRFIKFTEDEKEAVFSTGQFKIGENIKTQYLKTDNWYDISVKDNVLTYYTFNKDNSVTAPEPSSPVLGNLRHMKSEEQYKREQFMITVGMCQNCAANSIAGSINDLDASDIAKKIIAIREKLLQDLVERYNVGK